MITQDLINTLTDQREYSVSLNLSSIEFDFTCDDDDSQISASEQASLTNRVLTDGIELFRDTRPDPGDSLDLDVLQDVGVDQLADAYGWCVNGVTIYCATASIA